MTAVEPAPPPSLSPLYLVRELEYHPLVGVGGVVGREHPPATVIVSHARISRGHAGWKRVDPYAIEVRDMGSTNGTWVDDERLEGGGVILELGGWVDFGWTGRWRLDAAPPALSTLSADVGFRFSIAPDASTLLDIVHRGGQRNIIRGQKASLLMILARGIGDGKGGWISRSVFATKLYGARPIGVDGKEMTDPRANLRQLLKSTRATLADIHLAHLLEEDGDAVRLIAPPGGVSFP